MKRILRTAMILAVSLILLVIGTQSAFAGSLSGISSSDVLYVSIDQCVPGSEYLLLLVKPGTSADAVSGETILFVDQFAAQSSTIDIAVIFPDFSACDVLAGGQFSGGSDSPRKIGAYRAARMPNFAQSIEEEAFMNTKFTHIYLGENTEEIGARAFAGCNNLQYIYIPDSVNHIAEDAFSGCGSITIGCEVGSTAQSFAQNHQIPCKIIHQ